MAETWITWPEAVRRYQHGGLLSMSLLEDLAAAVRDAGTAERFLNDALSRLAADQSLKWTAIVRRTPQWDVWVSWGRPPEGGLTVALFDEALDREAAGRTGADDFSQTVVVPLPAPTNHLWVGAGHRLPDDLTVTAWRIAWMLSAGLLTTQQRLRDRTRIVQLEDLLRVAIKLAAEPDQRSLLKKVAKEATRLLDCDRASIFVWDRESHQLVACPAIGMADEQLWLPDHRGLVGDVVQTGESIRVDDAYSHERFDPSVDRESGYRTRTILCVPLLDEKGVRVGAFEAINKASGTFTDEDEQLLTDLGHQTAIALRSTQQREQILRSHRQMTDEAAGRIRIVGESSSIQSLRATIGRLAPTDLPVLILGESGTGKEVAAQALHYHGPRADHPFVAVNCAALTETLLESELFGHERGAFTDARETRTGKFELAEGGTIFLDEIGDMSLGGQAKLLRVLEQKVVTRVGGSQTIPINVRVIAATNAHLAQKVRDKTFREDLYYRLSVVTLDLPPLRERPEDVKVLTEYFLSRFCEQAGRPTLIVTPDAMRRLQSHSWPGNVRELRNLMERLSFLTQGSEVDVDDIAFILNPQRDVFDDLTDGIGLTEATNRFQSEYIRRAIQRVQGNMSEAARVLGLHRSNLYRKMRQLEMATEGDEEDGGD